jgi:murein L,D-transpeptidase YcbB/YkuD
MTIFLPPTKEELVTDIDYVRKNLYDVIEAAKSGMDELVLIAQSSQHPRAFEVLSTYMKQFTEMNQSLIKVAQEKREAIKETGAQEVEPGQAGGVTNNLFVGSTAELAKLLDTMKKKDGHSK